MNDKKADVKISLHFIVGLIFSVVLILIVLGGLNKISKITDPHYERDVVDQWVEDLEILNSVDDLYITELLSIKEVSPEYLFFIFQQTSEEIIAENPSTGFELRKPKTCSKKSCVCVFSTKNNEFDYCQTFGADQVSIYRVNYNPDDHYIIANEKVPDVYSKGQSDTHVSNNVFAELKVNGIVLCFNLEEGKCTG